MAKRKRKTVVRFIDLFSGIGGIRRGFEQAAKALGVEAKCVFTSEIKPAALKIHEQNYPSEIVHGDICKIDARDIPAFDFLLSGFPCQAFSAAGARKGFADPRGTLFFEVERILLAKKPMGFLLENVEGLVSHDMWKAGEVRPDKNDIPKSALKCSDMIGKTLMTILERLESAGYKVEWRVLNSCDFGVAQNRKRIYIVGTRNMRPDLDGFKPQRTTVESVLERGLPVSKHPFVKKLLKFYSVDDLLGKSIKDKRGGKNNIHSWDIEMKGHITSDEKDLLNKILTERRKHEYAEQYGIDWMDGMPLTEKMIKTFWKRAGLKRMLKDLVAKKYLKYEPPKRKVQKTTDGGEVIVVREKDPSLGCGYNIVAGKMSFEVSCILNPKGRAPTLVAMDMQHIYVADGDGIRPISLREGLRLFGYPEEMRFDISPLGGGYDLLGNTVVVPAIKAVAKRLLSAANIGGEKWKK